MDSISAIIGRNPQAVEKILGPPDKTEIIGDRRAPGSPKSYYRNGEFVIVFINNVADWITVNNNGSSTISDFIWELQLDSSKPTFFNQKLVARYNNMNGINE